MLKHKSEECKISTGEYFLTEDITQGNSCRIFECSPASLLKWIEQYDEENDVKINDRQIIAYKIKQNEVNFILQEIKNDKTITMENLLTSIHQVYPAFDVTKRCMYRGDMTNLQTNKKYTFSNYKLTDVKNKLIHSIQVSDIETSCYWAVELICSNNFQKLWDIIFYFYATYIHISNPKAVNYLDSRFKTFKQIYESVEDPIVLTDNTQLRYIFGEIVTTLCLSKKMYMVNYVGVPHDDFNMALIYIKYKAPSQEYITPFYKENDPKHMISFFNEFIYNIESKNCFRAYYWLEYILGYEKILH